jgi:hypothetical protein
MVFAVFMLLAKALSAPGEDAGFLSNFRQISKTYEKV